jgi:PAS domain-containing protein
MHRFLSRLNMNQPGKLPEPSAQGLTARRVGPVELAWGPLDLADEGVVLLDVSGKITETNDRALELLHCTLPAVSGRDFWDAVPEEIAEQHQSATDKAMSSSAYHAFVANQAFEGSWVEYTFRRQRSGPLRKGCSSRWRTASAITS